MDQLDHQAVNSSRGRGPAAPTSGLRALEHVPQRQTRPVELMQSPRCAIVSAPNKAAILELLVRANDAFSAHDLDAYLDTCVFPLVRIAPEKITVIAAREHAAQSILTTGLTPNYWRSEWVRLEIVQAGQDKVHVAAVSSRQRSDGREISREDSLFVLECVNGHWGVRAHSYFSR